MADQSSTFLGKYEAKKRMNDSFKKKLSNFQTETEIFQTILAVLSAVEFILASYIQIDIDQSLFALIIIDLIFSSFFIIFFFVSFVISENK